MKLAHTARSARPLLQEEDEVLRRGQAEKGTALPRWPIATTVSALALAIYAFLFWSDLSRYWFHPGWATDDSLQQTYPFHKVANPGLFSGDLITAVMEGYLPPIHYWLSYALTWLTGSPVMAGHWVMLIQLGAAAAFLFLAVRSVSSTAAGLFAVTWLLHTRLVVQRLTGGLPRGWSAVVLAAFLYCALGKKHRGMLLTLVAGCLLHPPSTLIAALAYGAWVLAGFLRKATRREFQRPFIELAAVAPLCVVLVLTVISRPPEIGPMVSYEEAAQMPEFQRGRGRFPFVPFNPPEVELRTFAFQAFNSRLYQAGPLWREYRLEIVAGLVLLLGVAGVLRRRSVVPIQLWFFFGAIITVWLLSRALAFKLYVPDRHLQFPMAFLLIALFSAGTWRAIMPSKPRRVTGELAPLSAFLLLALVIYSGSGSGLQGTANFNWASDKRGKAFEWIKENTEIDALIAGEPTHIDPVMLFGERQGYVTTETAHPFYPRYNLEMRRRLEVSLRAHYAKDLTELLSLVEPEGIDYFVFARRKFTAEELKKVKYFPPLDGVAAELASRPPEAYAYSMLPERGSAARRQLVSFEDSQSVVISIRELRRYLESKTAGDQG